MLPSSTSAGRLGVGFPDRIPPRARTFDPIPVDPPAWRRHPGRSTRAPPDADLSLPHPPFPSPFAVYELHNLSALRCFIQDNVEPGEEFLCTLNGDFLSPSLLSSLDLGAAAVSAMNAVPVTHACLGNHEFDHSIEVLGQRLAELDCDVVNTNVFACPPGEEDASAAAASAALASESSVPHPELSVGRASAEGAYGRNGQNDATEGAYGRNGQNDATEADEATSAFLDRLPRSRVVTVGNVTVGLIGVCTTSTPLSSARKPRGVVFAEAVPVAREHARRVAPVCDAVVALTHQTLPEDARLAEEVPEIAVILGGHEHTPFAGRMGHGANAAAAGANGPIDNGGLSSDTECVNDLAGTLCVKAGMDAENVVVVVVEAPGADPSSTIGADRGGECTAEAAAAAATAAAEARKSRDDFGEGGLWRNNVVADPGSAPAERTTTTTTNTTTDDRPSNPAPPKPAPANPAPASQPTNVALNHGHAHDLHGVAPTSVAPGAEIGTEVTVRRPGSGVVVSARMYSLRGYRTDPGIDADIWRRSEVLRGLNQHTLSLHEHAARLGLTPLSSRDARVAQCSLGTLFATILRDECRADVCLYNSGGIRGNVNYGGEPLTYGDLVAEVPFENNIVTLEMYGSELAAAIAFSEAERVRVTRAGGSWGGYLQWDAGVAVSIESSESSIESSIESSESSESSIESSESSRTGGREVDVDPADESSWRVDAVFGETFDPSRRYRVVTWAGLLDGADDIPVFRDIGRRLAAGLADDCEGDDETCEPATVAISGSDGIPFKNLVMRHLCRRRWLEILTAAGGSFEALDGDGDGAVTANDVRDALVKHTSSLSADQEAEAMVRSFDGDGDGALCARDVDDLMEHFRGDRFEMSERFAANRIKTQAEETARFDALVPAEGAIGGGGKGKAAKGGGGSSPGGGGRGVRGGVRGSPKTRGEEVQARGTRARRGGEL